MTRTNRVAVLWLAIAVHAAALIVVHRSMVEFTLGERLALLEASRIVVSAPAEARRVIASQQCPAPRVL